MFNYIFSAVIVCAFFAVSRVLAGPTQINAAEKMFRTDVNYPSVHVTLLSIEDKLRNLENTLGVQCTTAIHGKIDYYGRKIDNIERDLSRFQVHMRMELDKISENISSNNYKDDITKDRIIRKIDVIYERINHRLGNIEGQIDITNIKSQNAREMVITKLEKMEDSLTIRDADMEAELADAVAAIDDLKTTCTNMEENIANVTKESAKSYFKSSEKSIKKQHSQTINILEGTNKNLSASIANIHNSVNLLLNQTNTSSDIVKYAKEELDQNLNEYANKITDMYSDLWQKTDTLDSTIQNLAKVANLTRSEQQNGLRALMVQVGRKSGKQGVQSDSSIESQKLEELGHKIDANFENVLLAQNLFLESCHRVQMDESQLESQISIVLDKLIDIFENKTSVGPKDIEQLEQLIRTHDSNIRRSIYHITNNLLNLMKKTSNGNDEIIDYINNQRLHLEAVHVLLQEVLNVDDSEQTQNILETLQDLQQQLNKSNQQTYASLSQINSTNTFIIKMLNTSSNLSSEINNVKLQKTLEFIKNIFSVLTSIEMKINKSYLDNFFNKYNIDSLPHRFDAKYIPRAEGINSSELKHVHFVDPYDDYPYTIETNASKTINKSENIVLLCDSESTTVNCTKINNTSNINITQNSDNNDDCLPNYINLIDVRSNDGTNATFKCLTNITIDLTPATSNISHNITSIESPQNRSFNECVPNYIDLINGTVNCTIDITSAPSNITTTETPLNKSLNECLPNYIDLIDVRSNDGANTTTNCSLTTSASTDNSTNLDKSKCLPNYNDLIDVRYNGQINITSNCSLTNVINVTQYNTTNLDDVEAYDIDVRFGESEDGFKPTTEDISNNQDITLSTILPPVTTENGNSKTDQSSSNSVENDETTATIYEVAEIITEETYGTYMENDSSEFNTEFEYTNHEYP